VHDIVDLEGRGVPGVFVASTGFVTAAESQSAALGFPAASVFVTHPIANRTDDELRSLADGALHELLAALVAGPGQPAGQETTERP
jgi:hypothetical protein